MKRFISLALMLLLMTFAVAGMAEQGTDLASTDYSNAENWYRIPEITKDVDTIYIYPTVYANAEENAPAYAPLGDPMMLDGVENMYQIQASVYEDSTNLFIPYYRQANLTIEVQTYLEKGDIQSCLENLPEIDMNAALDYYFEHYNQGRPFIIAGHSQGSAMTRLVLKHYFKEHPEYYERMVAAYVIGYSITRKDLEENPHMKFAEGAEDVGVIVSWNTEGPGNKGANNVARVEGAISINPLNWKLDDTYASAKENLGSRVVDEATGAVEYKDIGADAQVDMERGVVISHADFPFIGGGSDPLAASIFGTESFHNGDYALYFNNIRQNIETRIDRYFEKLGTNS